MKNILFAFSLLLVLGCQSSNVNNGVPNLARLSPGVWRGGQPTAEGWQYLRGQGVTNVIKLNEGSDAYATNLGMTLIEWPINLKQQLGLQRLDHNYVWVSGQLRDCTNRGFDQGLFIHCEHGQDRAGLVVAQYRMFVQGWSKPEAEKEMLAHGFHKGLVGLWHYWKTLKPINP